MKKIKIDKTLILLLFSISFFVFILMNFILVFYNWSDQIGILALSSMFSGICAILIAFLDKVSFWYQKPILSISFEDINKPPYGMLLASDPYNQQFIIGNESLLIYKPMFNVRIKIQNIGRETAKHVIAKIERIEFLDFHNNFYKNPIFYHPTTLKWSGESDWTPVDILPNSYHFLDLIRIYNEKNECLIKNNYNFHNKALTIEELKSIVDTIDHEDIIYWNVWVKEPGNRGIPRLIKHEGNIKFYILVYSSNAKPLRICANIKWEANNWNQPNISLKELNHVS